MKNLGKILKVIQLLKYNLQQKYFFWIINNKLMKLFLKYNLNVYNVF